MTQITALVSPSHTGPSTSDPLRSIVDATAALRAGAATGAADVAAIERNLGLVDTPPPAAPANDHGVILLVVGLLVLVGAVGVVIYVVRRK